MKVINKMMAIILLSGTGIGSVQAQDTTPQTWTLHRKFRQRSRVDFPVPDGPRMATISFFFIFRLMSFRTSVSVPNVLDRFSTVTICYFPSTADFQLLFSGLPLTTRR